MVVLTCFGQTSAGNLLLGGSLQFRDQEDQYSHRIDGKNTNNSFGGQLQGGKFVRDKLALGLGVQYTFSKNTSEIHDSNLSQYTTYKIENFTAGPFIRKYVALTEKFFFYGQGTTGLTFWELKQETSNNNSNLQSHSRYLGVSAAISPGLTYFISDKVGLDLGNSGLSYSYYRGRENKSHSHSINLGLDLASLTYGVRFYFAR